MTHDEKLEVAQLLDQMGVDVIEAGFPAASNGDFEAVAEISKLVKNAVVAGLARGNAKDIDRAGEAVRHARRGRIHTFIGTSPIHRQFQLQMSADQVLRERDRLGNARPQAHGRRGMVGNGRDAHRARFPVPRR